MSRFHQGCEVRLLYDVVNDGTVYGVERGKIIQEAGSVGYIKQFGDLINGMVYDVHFLGSDQIIGCRDWELADGDVEWQPAVFENKELVVSSKKLASTMGNIPADTKGKVVGVRYLAPHGYVYEVNFDIQGEQRFLVTRDQIKAIQQ